MKKISLFVLVLSLVALTAACGSGGAPAPQAAPTSPPEATPTSPPEAIPTSPPLSTLGAGSDPTPASAEAPASVSGASGETQEIPITVLASGYEPASIKVKAGSHIRFVFTNKDGEIHDLYSRSPKMEVEFAPGKTTTYEWTAPQAAGPFTAECTYHEGLTLTVIVE